MAGPAEANGWGPVRVSVNNGGTTRITPTLDELVEAAHRHLQTLGVTLYGQTFNIIEDRDVAAEWLAGEVRAVLREAWWPKWSENL